MEFFDRVLHYFYEISAIPRASYHEDKIADYLMDNISNVVSANKMANTFDSNKIVVLSINIGENRALAKIIATFLKLSFQKYILSRFKNKY